MKNNLWTCSLCLTALLATSFFPQQEDSRAMAEAANQFLLSLGSSLYSKAQLSFESDNRTDWSYLPGRRAGVSLKQLNMSQRESALNLLRSALSERGYSKAKGVIALEGILRDVERNDSRDPELYWFTVFGSPLGPDPWGWRMEGHHLSLNFSSVTKERTASTPAFLGANPATVPSGEKKGARLLGAEEDLALQLVLSLTAAQKKTALIDASAPSDIITGTDRKARLSRFEGVAYTEMDEHQRALLVKLLQEYVNNMRPDIARQQMQRITGAGVEKIHFAWAGQFRLDVPHYYRLHGPTLLIELDNTQNNANHVHSVWRDPERDFGEDLLLNHYRTSEHHRH